MEDNGLLQPNSRGSFWDRLIAILTMFLYRNAEYFRGQTQQQTVTGLDLSERHNADDIPISTRRSSWHTVKSHGKRIRSGLSDRKFLESLSHFFTLLSSFAVIATSKFAEEKGEGWTLIFVM